MRAERGLGSGKRDRDPGVCLGAQALCCIGTSAGRGLSGLGDGAVGGPDLKRLMRTHGGSPCGEPHVAFPLPLAWLAQRPGPQRSSGVPGWSPDLVHGSWVCPALWEQLRLREPLIRPVTRPCGYPWVGEVGEQKGDSGQTLPPENVPEGQLMTPGCVQKPMVPRPL